MKKLIFATTNQGKINELRKYLGKDIELLTLKDFPNAEDVEETEDTYKGNALLKAKYLHDLTGLPVLSDDSGIEIEALHGFREEGKPFPSIYSARAFSDHDTDKNVQGVLDALNDINLNTGKFIFSMATYFCCLCFYDDKGYTFYKSEMDGIIFPNVKPKGTNGFAYDTIFYPILHNNYPSEKTYAEMEDSEKNMYSHRIKAIKKFLKEKDID